MEKDRVNPIRWDSRREDLNAQKPARSRSSKNINKSIIIKKPGLYLADDHNRAGRLRRVSPPGQAKMMYNDDVYHCRRLG